MKVAQQGNNNSTIHMSLENFFLKFSFSDVSGAEMTLFPIINLFKNI